MSALPRSSSPAPRLSVVPAEVEIPPLEDGDHLTRPEFERRYNAMPDVNKAQLIEGRVYMPSPVKISKHSEPHACIIGLLYLYYANTPGTSVGDNGSLRLDLDNMPQPDAYLRYLESHNGQSKLTTDDFLEGAPELIVEIAASSATIDLHDKLRAYRRNGVKEYVVWLTHAREVRYHVLRESDYERIAPDDAGVLRSEVFPGLWLDAPALIARDAAKQVETLQAGIRSRASTVESTKPTPE